MESNAFKILGDSIPIGGNGAADTTLRLDLAGLGRNSFAGGPKGLKRKWSVLDRPSNQMMELSLGLNLHIGNSSSSSDSKGSTATVCTSMSSAKETEEESSMDLDLDFSLHLGGDKSSGSEKPASSYLKPVNASPKVDLQLSLSSGPALSDITAVHSSSNAPMNSPKMTNAYDAMNVDGGPNPVFVSTNAQNMENISFPSQPIDQIISSSVITMPKGSATTCTSGITTQSQQQRSSCTKQCQFQGCTKGARGASGLCIAHGGGRRCQRPNCSKGAEGRTAFCKAHGGGRRCEFLGCTKSAEGRTDFCIAHGGGRRCSHDGCSRAARGRSGLCIRHGGGKRCQRENCTKSAEGLSGLCISHGGGRRCQFPNCSKGAQGSTMFCKAHGGGRRCTFLGCNKGAEGSTPFCKGHGGGKRCSYEGGGVCPKSVHGGTLFCVAHGGGKRCAVKECTRSARGRTDFCVRHGGGKRCKFEGCGKSAQGSTDFCKAHGGGNRCSWGHVGSGFGLGDGPCESIARARTGFCAAHGGLVQDKRVHGGETVGIVVVHDPSKGKKSPPLRVDVDNSVVTYAKDYCAPQPSLSMISREDPMSKKLPEGRVHGGNLLAMFSGHPFGFNFKNNAGTSEAGKSFEIRQSWV